MPNPLAGITFRPTFIIGLGSTGLDILQAFQELWYERFHSIETDIVRLINIETAEANLIPKGTPGGNMITTIFVRGRGFNLEDQARKLRTQPNPFPNHVTPVPNMPWDWDWTKQINWHQNIGSLEDAGLGGVRAVGRVILHGDDPSTNIKTSISIINELANIKNGIPSFGSMTSQQAEFQKLGFELRDWMAPKMVPDPRDYNKRKDSNNCYFESMDFDGIVVGSLTGGTASGMAIDIGYMLKSVLAIRSGQNKRITGIFLIPPKNESALSGEKDIAWKQVRANALATIHDLDFMRDHYATKDPATGQYSLLDMPYGYLYLVAPEYNSGDHNYIFQSLQGLVDSIALRLFINVLGYKHKAEEVLTDAWTQNPKNFFLTTGICSVVYPKFRMAEAVASDLTSSLCEVLSREGFYVDVKAVDCPINIGNIERAIERNVNEIMQDLIPGILSTVPEGTTISKDDHIEYLIEKIKKEVDHGRQALNESFLDPHGYFEFMLATNAGKVAEEVTENVKKFFIKELGVRSSLDYVKETISAYISEFESSSALLTRQGRPVPKSGSFLPVFDGPNEIKAAILQWEKYRKMRCFKAALDMDEIYRDSIRRLFERKMYATVQVNLVEILKKLREWKSVFESAMSSMKIQAGEFAERGRDAMAKMDTNLRYAPKLNLFVNSAASDKDALKKLVIRNRPKPIWNDVVSAPNGISPNMLWDMILTQKTGMEAVHNKFASVTLTDIPEYLTSKRFDLTRETVKAGNQQEVSNLFSMAKAGFLDVNPPQNRELGRKALFMVAGGNVDEIFNTYAILGGANKFINPLFDNMIIFTEDKHEIEPNRLRAFRGMKEALMVPSPQQPQHTQIRFAYGSKPNFTLLEVDTQFQISLILKYMNIFWVDRRGGASAIAITGGNMPVGISNIDPGVGRRTSGIYLDRSIPRFYFTDGLGRSLDFNVESPEHEVINELCVQTEIMLEPLKQYFRQFLPFDDTAFFQLLNEHYRNSIQDSPLGKMAPHNYLFGNALGIGTMEGLRNVEDAMSHQICFLGQVRNIYP
ncbi:MAG: tubulin-like doman-containing protein [Acidobacteriota bacterium]|nr:tubulin-like doman-containing protein [Acidobacteriota bacterium]